MSSEQEKPVPRGSVGHAMASFFGFRVHPGHLFSVSKARHGGRRAKEAYLLRFKAGSPTNPAGCTGCKKNWMRIQFFSL
jgi:hypothetical protein